MNREIRQSHRIRFVVPTLLVSLMAPDQVFAATKTVKLELLEESQRTSYEGSVPIAARIVPGLSEAGLRVVADEKLIASIKRHVAADALPVARGAFDALLGVRYEGRVHETEKYIRGMPVTQTTASVTWEFRLQDRRGKVLFEKSIARGGPVYIFSEVLDSLYLQYLGDFIRSALEGHGEKPVLLEALESESATIREEAREALRKLGEEPNE